MVHWFSIKLKVNSALVMWNYDMLIQKQLSISNFSKVKSNVRKKMLEFRDKQFLIVKK